MKLNNKVIIHYRDEDAEGSITEINGTTFTVNDSIVLPIDVGNYVEIRGD